MELSDFIKRSVKEVIEGVENSADGSHEFELAKDLGIEFDVAVSSTASRGAEGTITVLSARAKLSEEKIHRLRFRVHPKARSAKDLGGSKKKKGEK